MSLRDILAKTLMAEAGGEGPQGMLAAGAVMQNRVRTGGYGNDLRSVIMKPGQFSAWNSITGYANGQGGLDMNNMRPSGTAYQVADTLLSGQYEDPTGGATHYYNPSVANPKWGQRNGGEWQRIGNHIFGNADAGRKVSGGGGNQTVAGGLSLTPSSPPDHLQGAQMQQPDQRQHMFMQNMDPAKRDRLIMAMQGMTMNPNQGLMAMAQQNMQDRATAGREAKAEAKGAEQRNRTAEWLMTQPGGQEYAQAIASGALPAAAALQMWQKASAGPDQTSMQQQYAQAVSQGYQGTLMDYQLELKNAGASKTTVNTAPTGQRHGTIPQGYTIVEDPQSEAGYRMVPIPGGPEDQTAKTELANEGTRRSGDVVIEDIDRVIAKMDDGGLPVAGMGGGLLSGVPGTDAHDASKLLQTIRANVGFDRLQQMRDSSPTGGALGAINQSEMTLLNSALGSLEQSQSPEQFRQNLERLRGIYGQIVHGAGGQVPAAPTQEAQPLSDDDLLKKYGGN